MSNKEMVPEIRFEGYEGEWKEKKFEELLSSTDGLRRGPFGSALKKEYFIEDGPYGVYEQQNAIYKNTRLRYFITEDKYNELQAFKLQPGDIIMSGAGTIGRVYKIPTGFQPGVFNQALIRMRTNENLDEQFFVEFLESEKMQEKLTQSNPGSAMVNLLPMDELKKMNVFIPEEKHEQKEIGNLISRVNNNVELKSKELETLNNFKQAMLQKMFPKEGETVPEIRFDGFNNEWELVKLKDLLVTEFKGKAQAEKLSSGHNEYLDANRLNGGVPIKVSSTKDVSKEDILILWDGSKAGTVYHGFNGVLGSTLKAFVVNEEHYPTFIYQYLRRSSHNIFINFRTPNIPHVVRDFTERFMVPITSLEEQKLIGNYFETLDKNISYKQAELKKLKQFKQAMLDKMFV